MKEPSEDRIEEIFHQAVALPPSQRPAFVAKECGGDPHCERLVHSYLEADASASDDLLGSPVETLFPDQDDLVEIRIAGRYVVESELGHGGMSQVYLARDENLKGERVVIKVLSRDLLQDQYAQQKFDQEVEALLRIRHHGIVDVRDTGKLDDGRPFIVMQYIDGETLGTQIPTGGMDLNRAAVILKQIGEALEHVHRNSVFHRDLKPANVLVKRESDSVVLIDFGIAKVLDSSVAQSTVDGSSAGTVPYMSPEQLRAETVTAASDIYSMAVVAYEMVTGRQPFKASSAGQLIDLQRKGVRMPGALRSGISKRAEKIILRGLSFDPKDRYQSAKAFGDQLAAALLHEEVEADSDGRRRKLIGAIAAVIVVSLLAYVISTIIDIGGPDPRSKGFNYWITVQLMRDGNDYGEPYQSNGGDDTFDAGDKFQLNVQSLEPGYVYVFSEGYSETGDVSFAKLSPKEHTSNNIGADQTIQFDWLTFRGPAGAENVWIVWSASPVAELESASAQALVKVKEFLQKQTKGDVRKYKKGNYATVRAKSDLVITLAQFKHR